MANQVHIISFDVPFPADYGGVIDVFYKVKALSELGVGVHLHCFAYGRGPAKELEAMCQSVTYYPRHTTRKYLLGKLPYIVATRRSDRLMANLAKDNHPILFEGLHCCGHLADAALANRHKVVRTHNIEHDYYRHLAKAESNPFKRFYFNAEADKLEKFEKVLSKAQAVAAISRPDAAHVARWNSRVETLSAFHPNQAVESMPGTGNFCLYHGNLAVGENNQAALYLVDKIFSGLNVPLIIAGNGASSELRNRVASQPNMQLRDKVSTSEIHQLIREAHINVLPTFQATGIKIKLLAALYMGRHCVVNGPMVQDTGLESACRVESSDKRIRAAITELMTTPFTDAHLNQRLHILGDGFSNATSAKRLCHLLFG